jgi:hypothetical protein
VAHPFLDKARASKRAAISRPNSPEEQKLEQADSTKPARLKRAFGGATMAGAAKPKSLARKGKAKGPNINIIIADKPDAPPQAAPAMPMHAPMPPPMAPHPPMQPPGPPGTPPGMPGAPPPGLAAALAAKGAGPMKRGGRSC